jgi:hypothetical protein
MAYENRLMSSNPAEVRSNPYQTASSSLPDSSFSKASTTYSPTGMLGSANNPVGNSTRVGSMGGSTPGVNSFNDTTNPQSKSALPASTPSSPAIGSSSLPESPTTSSPVNAYGNDMTQANAMNAAADQMRKDREGSNPGAATGMNAQMQQFFSALGAMANNGQTNGMTPEGLNSLFGFGVQPKPEAPQMMPGDNSRFADDPFRTVNSLR